MRTISNAEVTWLEPGIFEDLVNARVTFHGSTASIWAVLDSGKSSQVDRLTDATEKEGGDGFIYTGKSEHLIQRVGVLEEDAVVNIRVKGNEDCPNC